MTVWGDRINRQLRLILLTLFFILVVLLLALFFPPDGIERSDGAQFVGRFHPLAVHFPIALMLLVPILELAGLSERFSHLRATSSFVLGLATWGATVAAILGWCLARSGGYSGPLVIQHMWGGVSLAAICWMCWFLHAREHGSGIVYAIVLAIGVGLVAWTGYRGGQLSLGEDHLIEHMPAGLRDLLGLSDAATPKASTAANTLYSGRIQPIFAARCISCHGPAKHKGELRLDNYAAVMRGGKDGRVVLAGNAPGSDLVRRITLLPGNDDFMPKEGKQPLSPDQVKLIELWIAGGASETLPLDAIKDAPAGSTATPAPAEAIFEEIDPAAVARRRAPIATLVAKLQKQFPNILDYESRGTADLVLNASILGPKFGDVDLAVFAPIAGDIAIADFSRTAITDRSAETIAAMKRLRVLRLMNTEITDRTLEGLGGLDQLESLSVFGTRVTTAALPTVASLPKLAHCYVGQTAISSGASVPQALTGKLVF